MLKQITNCESIIHQLRIVCKDPLKMIANVLRKVPKRRPGVRDVSPRPVNR